MRSDDEENKFSFKQVFSPKIDFRKFFHDSPIWEIFLGIHDYQELRVFLFSYFFKLTR
jgi:hypothetical protein